MISTTYTFIVKADGAVAARTEDVAEAKDLARFISEIQTGRVEVGFRQDGCWYETTSYEDGREV